MKILLINGPNLNLLGSRETDIYGNTSLEQIESNLCSIAEKEDCNLTCFQSNAEHELINAVHSAVKITSIVLLLIQQPIHIQALH